MTSYLLKGGLLAAALTLFATPVAAVEPTGPGVPAATGFKLNTLVKGLQNPWGLAFLPGGDILVTERPGRMRIIREGKLVEEPIKGVPPVFALGQGGLLDVSLHPKFAENNLVYFTYAQGDNKANHTVLGRGKLTGMELTDVKELLKVQPSKPGTQHFGSVIEWLPDGTLLFSVGDGGNAPLKVDGILARDQAQRMDRYAGKVLRVNDDGTAPKDNPFVNQSDAKPEIWSLGHR